MKDFKKNSAPSIALGMALFALSAVFTVALLLQAVHYEGSNFLNSLGRLLFLTYGASSVIIPLFLLIAALDSFLNDWSHRKAMRLVTAVVPFFTCVEAEKISHAIIDNPFEDFATIKVCVILGIALLLVVIELLLATKLADKISGRSKVTLSPVTPNTSGDDKIDEVNIKSEATSDINDKDDINNSINRDEKVDAPASTVPVANDSSLNPLDSLAGGVFSDPLLKEDQNEYQKNNTIQAESTHSSKADTKSFISDKSIDAFSNVFDDYKKSAPRQLGGEALPRKDSIAIDRNDPYALGATVEKISKGEDGVHPLDNLSAKDTTHAQKTIDKKLLSDNSVDYSDPMSVITEEEYATLTNSDYTYGDEKKSEAGDTEELDWPEADEIKAKAAPYDSQNDDNTNDEDKKEEEETKKKLNSLPPPPDLEPVKSDPPEADFLTSESATSVMTEKTSTNPFAVGTVIPYTPEPEVVVDDTVIDDRTIEAPDLISDDERLSGGFKDGDTSGPDYIDLERTVVGKSLSEDFFDIDPNDESLDCAPPAESDLPPTAPIPTSNIENNRDPVDSPIEIIDSTKEKSATAIESPVSFVSSTVFSEMDDKIKNDLRESADDDSVIDPLDVTADDFTVTGGEGYEDDLSDFDIDEVEAARVKSLTDDLTERLLEKGISSEAISKTLNPPDDTAENKDYLKSIDAAPAVVSSAPSIDPSSINPPAPVVEKDKDIPFEAEKKPITNYYIPTSILAQYENDPYWVIDEKTKADGVKLHDTLKQFNIEATVIGIKKGPVVTMFELSPAPGVKLSKIVALQDNIALNLAASSVRIVAPIPGKAAVGIEVPNKTRSIVSLRQIMEEDLDEYKKMAVPVILGKDIMGKAQVFDLVKTPHLLIAGATGAGKSVCVNTIILSILFKRSPDQVKLILIDPKVVELKLYNDIPHLLTSVITEPKKAIQALQYCLCEMERRYAMLDKLGVRDIASYNKRLTERNIMQEKLPYLVVIIDEFADLMATTSKELERLISRLCAMSRAIGIHIVLATQRPSIDVITGIIKANIPTRIAFMVASKMDSRIIIDQVGAEMLLGKGDMLYASAVDPFPVRIQGTYVSDSDVEKVVEYVKGYGEPQYIDDEIFIEDDDEDDTVGVSLCDGPDPLYDDAVNVVVEAGKASASYIQRRLKIGYNRAARLIEDMEAHGIVGPANGSKPRELLHVPA